jgi:hypothetical protein
VVQVAFMRLPEVLDSPVSGLPGATWRSCELLRLSWGRGRRFWRGLASCSVISSPCSHAKSGAGVWEILHR